MSKSWKILQIKLINALKPHGAISEFMRKTGFSRTAIDKWLLSKDEGGSAPNIEHLDIIADALGLDPTEAIKSVDKVRKPSPEEALDILKESVKRLHELEKISSHSEKYANLSDVERGELEDLFLEKVKQKEKNKKDGKAK